MRERRSRLRLLLPKRYFWRIILRFTEVVGVMTACVFVFEAIAKDRGLPHLFFEEFSAEEVHSFFSENAGQPIYVDFHIYEGNISAEDATYFGDWGVLTIADVVSLRQNPLLITTNDLSETGDFYFKGPVFVLYELREGDTHVELVQPPYLDSLAQRAQCASLTRNYSGLRYAYRYTMGCILGLLSR
jgi:hypothetical protein